MLTGLSAMEAALLLASGVALDLLLGEARRWHPLVGFGNLAKLLERRLNAGSLRIVRGLAAWMLAVLPLAALALLFTQELGYAAHAVLLYFSLGLRSLRDHTVPIHAALMSGDLA
ncbi:MAG TPA: cobalamin biosynthesis protein, partial [Telluria sp.]|nr:cobalamin biosynthesis protein [Telluria sp.]